MVKFLCGTVALASFLGLFGLALVPMGLSLATDMSVVCIAGVMVLALLPGRTARLFFVTLCAWVVVRYIGWRVTSLPLDGSTTANVATLLLLGAELYGVAMLLLGLFVNAWLLERKPAPLPANERDYPTVDIYIPTYSEPISVVAPTLLAAMEIDYPKSKFRVYVLDDGYPRSLNPSTPPEKAYELAERSMALKALCEKHGATWLTREKNEHAKSGNMNAAMSHTDGSLLLILDADHVPTRDILKNTAGFFSDPKLAFVQTPHFFVNPDPIEKNLGLFNRMPAENDMFYRVVQKGLDLWNTSFFCGSAALIRRTAVEDVGGFSKDSITEDASTSVKMHQKGWRSAYLGIPMIAGLQPETFAAFTLQRLRWAMGMMQILLKQNPLLVRGLEIPQRLAYLSVMMFWLFPFARIAFFVAPLLSLIFNLTIYPVGMEYFIAYTIPYLVAVIMSRQKSFGRVRTILVSELHETLQAFYALPALISTVLKPNAPTFKVTPKGEKLTKEYISELHTPFYIFYAMTILGLVAGIVRMVLEPGSRSALTLSVSWEFFNLILLSGALGVLMEAPQRRERPRIEINEKVTLVGSFGHREAILVDLNEHAGLLRVLDGERPKDFSLLLDRMIIPCKLIETRRASTAPGEYAVEFIYPSPAHERAIVTLAYGSSARWMKLWETRESSANFVGSAFQIMAISIRGGLKHLKRLMQDTN